jgi:hypothetical protein
VRGVLTHDSDTDPLRRVLDAWDEAEVLAELEILTIPPENHRTRTREERAAVRAVQADWDAENAGAGRPDPRLTRT